MKEREKVMNKIWEVINSEGNRQGAKKWKGMR